MRAVNLLPGSERARVAAPVPKNTSKIVIACLGLLLVATAGFVFTKNQVTDRKSEIATATVEKQQAEQRASQLGAFGNFAAIKQTRVRSVTELADNRFDWERMLRELALVLPKDVWLSEVRSGSETTAGTESQSDAAAPAAGPAQATGPTVTLVGCAPSQKTVASAMVRVRSLHRAEDVQLKESAAEEAEGSGGSAAPATDSGSAEGGCGKRYKFEASIGFSAPQSGGQRKDGDRTPSRLGGGA